MLGSYMLIYYKFGLFIKSQVFIQGDRYKITIKYLTAQKPKIILKIKVPSDGLNSSHAHSSGLLNTKN